MDQSKTPVSSEVWNKQQLVDFLKVSKSTVNGWISTGYIPHVRLRRVIRFIPSEIREWLKTHTAGTDTHN
jgi:excisionase family DNA binding protein